MASIRKEGKVYKLYWRENGIQKKRSLGKISKREADTIKHAKEVELRTGQNILKISGPGSMFTSLAEEYLSWHKFEYPDSHSRVRQITHDYLIPFFDMKSVSRITAQDGERYKVERSKKVAVETVNKELRTLHAIINKHVEWGNVDRNPIKSVKEIRNRESKPFNFYTAEQLELIYGVDPDHAAIWKLMANTGARRAEALALKWNQVLPDRVHIVSETHSRTKSGKWRDVPLSPGAHEALEMLKGQGDYVLPRITGPSLSRAFSKAVKRAGLTGSLHDLRHTFCSHLVMKGIPLRTVQILAGHSSYKTTEGYAHLAPGHLQDSVAGLSL